MLTRLGILTTAAALVIFSPCAHSVGRGFCFEEAALVHGDDPLLLVAIAKVESKFNPVAINPLSGARGTMQIHPTHFTRFHEMGISEQDLLQPCPNIHAGTTVLADMKKLFGNTWRAVGAYGVGIAKDAKTEAQREVYARRVRNAYIELLARKLK